MQTAQSTDTVAVPLLPVILCGGSGTRLWPMSRKLYPKQLLPMLGGEETLLQSTLRRLEALPEAQNPLLLCNEAHRFMVAAQAQEIGFQPERIILEPVARNTAPAIAVAALTARAAGEDPLLLVLPADHHIADVEAFAQAVNAGRRAAQDGGLVTFGIVPDSPETGYGYIRMALQGEEAGAVPVSEFVEKPDQATAQAYLDSGNYVWNSGMFLLKASAYLEELERHNAQMLQACQKAVAKSQSDLDFLRLDTGAFATAPEDSIDYAVMEKTSQALVVPLSCGWSDVGSWAALHETMDQDADGNVFVGDVQAREVRRSYLHANSRLVAALGVEDVVLVETKDAILVAAMDHVQDIKAVVADLQAQAREVVNTHSKVFRPWGHYESIDTGPRYQVKRITVYPGQILSLQRHYHRSEHWVVVSGTAKVSKDDTDILLTEDQSVYLPLGAVHRLENVGKFNLELIEVQTGSYLGEDDIVRLEDVYGRLPG
ncbi:MAG: mannose-1-phosphate guanylyltransferase/mannose-6-phosphate isomerase [Desulfohalobium sp.]